MGTPGESTTRAFLLILGLFALASPAFALREFRPPTCVAQQTAEHEVVIVGTVTSFEKDLEEIKTQPGSKETLGYTVAVVKIETSIRGAKNTTHIKVGFVKVAEGDPFAERFRSEPFSIRNLKENNRYLLFLQKHSVGNFYTFSSDAVLKVTDANNQTDAIAEAKLAADAVADPLKSLKAEKTQDRALAAVALLAYYRQAVSRGPTERVPVDAEIGKRILQSLADGDWSLPISGSLYLSTAIQSLGLGEPDGWKHPANEAGANQQLVMQKAFQDWLAGPGKTFRVQQHVSKPKK